MGRRHEFAGSIIVRLQDPEIYIPPWLWFRRQNAHLNRFTDVVFKALQARPAGIIPEINRELMTSPTLIMVGFRYIPYP